MVSAALLIGCQTVGAPAGEPTAAGEELPEVSREFRAAWIATVANIDWPSEPGLPVEEQQAELRAMLDRAAALNLNAVIFQVRPAADALYDSRYEPWSEFLTGEMGKAPEPYYDPLEFAIEEAHKRGLELHAWFNPYRALHPAAESEISGDHISETQPEIVREYGTHLWLDPGEPEAHAHTLNVILDVVERYDVDGIHFDDYFYPYGDYADGADFPDDESWDQAQEEGASGSRDDWRRENVDRLVADLYEAIKARKPHVKFGISPFGIWRPGHPEGTTGFDAHAELYADARKWLREGWVDYFTPQIYYRSDQDLQPYALMLRWWIEQNRHERHIWPGNIPSSVTAPEEDGWPAGEITSQIYTTRSHPEAEGNVHFSMRAFTESPDSLHERLAAHAYQQPALVPASPWLGSERPDRPRVEVSAEEGRLVMSMAPPPGNSPRWWVVRSRTGSEWIVDVVPGRQRQYVLAGSEKEPRPDEVAVSAVSRLGREGPPESVGLEGEAPAEPSASPPSIIARSEWGEAQPLGHDADATRRNLSAGDTLRFRDLRLSVRAMKASEEAAPDSAQIILRRQGVREEWTVAEGQAFNWHGYHIGVLAVGTDEDALGGGLVEAEVARVGSLPLERRVLRQTGSAEERLRISHEITDITLHHTGSPEPLDPDDDPAEQLRGLQSWGAEARNWWDVPYHYLIDLEGRIYEGRDHRYMGETNTEYDPRGHLLISVMGNYNLQEPTEAQFEAIADLMAWATEAFDVSLEDISGHGDWADTTCPGEHLWPFLEEGELIEAVRERVENGLAE